jgi:hypothetical protein
MSSSNGRSFQFIIFDDLLDSDEIAWTLLSDDRFLLQALQSTELCSARKFMRMSHASRTRLIKDIRSRATPHPRNEKYRRTWELFIALRMADQLTEA